jgi:hypothetical protein
MRKVFFIFSNNNAKLLSFTRLCSEWSKNDCIYIFERKKYPDSAKIKKSTVQINRIAIPEGNTEIETWQIFKSVYSVLQDNDEVNACIPSSKDITGIIIFALFQFAKFTKNIQIKDIYYEGKKNSGIYKPIDLSVFSDIQDWAVAVNDFINWGNAKRLNMIAQKQIFPALNHPEKAEIETFFKLKELNGHILNFSENLHANQGQSLIEGKDSKRIIEIITQLQHYIPEPFHSILYKLKKAIQEMYKEKNENENMWMLVKWCIDKKLITEGLDLLQESIVAHFLTIHNDKIQQKFAYVYLNYRFMEVFDKKIQYETCSKIEKELKDHLESFDNITEWSFLFAQITKIRKEIDYGKMTGNIRLHYFEEKLKEFYEETLILLNSNSKSHSTNYYIYKEYYY